jgi:azurin
MSKVLSRRNFLKVSSVAATSALLAACGGGEEPKPAAPSAAGPVSLEIDSVPEAGSFKYTKASLEAPPGSKITLKFNNKTDAAAAVGHNWALVKKGKEDTVVNNGTAAGDANGWMKPNDPDIIAHTKLIKGGESDSVTFDAPAAGTYSFLCTFPGHYAGGMKGDLKIG